MVSPSSGRTRPRFRFGLKLAMGIVLAWALALAGLRLLVKPYRRGWQAEQEVLAEIGRGGNEVVVSKITVGPRWLRQLIGPGPQAYFDRVHSLSVFGPEFKPSASLLARLKHLNYVMVDAFARVEIEGHPDQPVDVKFYRMAP